jgi:cytochrome b561
MPLSGWLMASTTPVRVPTFVFGLFELPYPLALDFATYRFARAIHVASAISSRPSSRFTSLLRYFTC